MRLVSEFVTYPQGAGRFDKTPAVAPEGQRRKAHVSVSQLHRDGHLSDHRSSRRRNAEFDPPMVPQGFWNM